MTQTRTFSKKCTLGYGKGGNDADAAKELNKTAKEKNDALPAAGKKSNNEMVADAIIDGSPIKEIKEAVVFFG